MRVLFLLLVLSIILCGSFLSKCGGATSEYAIVVEWIVSPPDGYPRTVLGVFPATGAGEPIYPPSTVPVFPGPLIRAAQGDTLEVTLFNRLAEHTTSIHFHGLHMQGNPWADGAQGVTECGTPPGGNSTYRFQVTQTGTYWYHSHSGAQYGDGFLGPIILDYPAGQKDPLQSAYSYGSNDYILMLQDWFHETSDDLISLATSPRDIYTNFDPAYPWPSSSLLINGRGMTPCIWYDNCNQMNWSWVDCGDPIDTTSPQCLNSRPPLVGSCQPQGVYSPQIFQCPAGSNIRLRIINAASNMPLRFWVDQHSFLLVARDGVDIQPISVRFLTIGIGQRYDAILACNQSSSGSTIGYSIFSSVAPTYLPCGQNYLPLVTSALLVYNYQNQAPNQIPMTSPVPNPYISIVGPEYQDNMMLEYQITPLATSNQVAEPADHQITLVYEGVSPQGPLAILEYWTVNNKSYISPPSGAPLLQQMWIHPSATKTIGSSAPDTFLPFTIRLTANEVYQIVIVSKSSQQHPWHLHGYSVNFVGATEDASDLDSLLSTLPLNQAVPTLSYGDSFTVPANGAVVFRFKASNAGPWFFHCHVEWHLVMGMALVFSVENNDGTGYHSLIQPPPADFPVCGSSNNWGNCFDTNNSTFPKLPKQIFYYTPTLIQGLGMTIWTIPEFPSNAALVSAVISVRTNGMAGIDVFINNTYSLTTSSFNQGSRSLTLPTIVISGAYGQPVRFALSTVTSLLSANPSRPPTLNFVSLTPAFDIWDSISLVLL